MRRKAENGGVAGREAEESEATEEEADMRDNDESGTTAGGCGTTTCACTLRGVHTTKTTKDGQAERAHPARARLRAERESLWHVAVPEVALCLKVGSGRWQETVDSSRPRRRPRRPASSRPLRLGLDARAVELELGLGVGCRRLPLPRLALLLLPLFLLQPRPRSLRQQPLPLRESQLLPAVLVKGLQGSRGGSEEAPAPHPRAPPADRRLALGVGRAEQADAAGLGDPQLLADRGDEVLVVRDDEQPAPAVHVPATSPTADMHMYMCM